MTPCGGSAPSAPRSAGENERTATSSQHTDVVETRASDTELAELFKALSHPVRVSLMRRLRGGKRYCGDLVSEFDLAQSTISHHLRILREAGLLTVEEQGTRTCYTISENTLRRLCEQFVAMSTPGDCGSR